MYLNITWTFAAHSDHFLLLPSVLRVDPNISIAGTTKGSVLFELQQYSIDCQ
jgi:hypothetical protein